MFLLFKWWRPFIHERKKKLFFFVWSNLSRMLNTCLIFELRTKEYVVLAECAERQLAFFLLTVFAAPRLTISFRVCLFRERFFFSWYSLPLSVWRRQPVHIVFSLAVAPSIGFFLGSKFVCWLCERIRLALFGSFSLCREIMLAHSTQSVCVSWANNVQFHWLN